MSEQISSDKMVEVLSRTLNTIDGLWFQAVEEKYGFDAALAMDAEVWRTGELIHAKRLMKNFTIKESTPVRTVIKLLQIDPTMEIYKPEIVELTDNKAIFRCADCPGQAARVRDGKGEFPCEEVCMGIYSAYAEVVDPNLKVTCITCPPKPHPPEYFCEWQYEI